MKTELRHKSFSGILAVMLLSVTMTTCDRLKDDPVYAGTWQYKEKVYAGEVTYNTTDKCTGSVQWYAKGSSGYNDYIRI